MRNDLEGGKNSMGRTKGGRKAAEPAKKRLFQREIIDFMSVPGKDKVKLKVKALKERRLEYVEEDTRNVLIRVARLWLKR